MASVYIRPLQVALDGGLSDSGIVFNVQQDINNILATNNIIQYYYLGISTTYITLAEIETNNGEEIIQELETRENISSIQLNKWYKINLFYKKRKSSTILRIEIEDDKDLILFETEINNPKLENLYGVFGVRGFRQKTDFDSFC